jgi:pimeloyl-ACP methyl ester carboxylesterase
VTREIAGLRVLSAEPPAGAAGRPVLCVHGMWGGAWMFEPLLAFLAARGHPAYALDLRGHHGSKPVPDIGRVAVGDYVADAHAVAAALGNPVLVGHSMGGLLVQKLAALGEPPAVVAVTPAPPRGILAVRTPELARASLGHLPGILCWRALVPSRGEADALLFGRLDAAERARVFARLVPESGRAAFDMAVTGVPVDRRRVRCPMLVLAGAEDRITPATNVRRIAARYGAELRVYERHAHMLLMEPGWEDIAGDIVAWIKREVG